MSIYNGVSIYIFTLFVSIAIYIDSRKQFEKISLQDRLFTWMLLINSGLLVISIITIVCNGLPGKVFTIIHIFANICGYSGLTVIVGLWVLYVNYQIYHNIDRMKNDIIAITIVISTITVIAILSSITGWLFRIDEENIYHRGSLFLVFYFLNVGLYGYGVWLLLRNRKKMKSGQFLALIFFATPPVIFSIIQLLFMGLELILSGITISLLIVYFNFQNHTMNIDYLTGAYNRKSLDFYLRNKISETSVDKTFSAIMIDLNDFKMINDAYGHHVGDILIKDTVKMLGSIVRRDDFIARFGGDEFVIILDICSEAELSSMVSRINKAVEYYNEVNAGEYVLSLSMGYAVYNYESGMKPIDFLKHIDSLMYNEKRQYKCS